MVPRDRHIHLAVDHDWNDDLALVVSITGNIPGKRLNILKHQSCLGLCNGSTDAGTDLNGLAGPIPWKELRINWVGSTLL